MENNSIEIRLIINLILRLIIVSLFVIGFSSCKKYLDEKSNKSLVVPKSLDDLQGLLDDNSVLNENTPGIGETSADNIFLRLVTYNSRSEFERKVYTWRATNASEYVFQNDWALNYAAIYSANYCLDFVEKIDRNAQNEIQWDNVKGSSLFFRAHRNLCLLWDFGKAYEDAASQTELGIVLRLNSDFNKQSTRSTVKDCYERIISDAKEASKYLPNTPQHVMRPSKPAAYGLLARTYLSMRKYDSAFKYADLVLQIKGEILDFNGSEVNPSSDVPFQPFNKEIIFYSTQSGYYSPKSASRGLIDTLLYSSYNNNDLRQTAFFAPNAGFRKFKGSYAADEFIFFTGIATDEMLLTRAECYAKKENPNKDAAMNDLNTLLLNRWVSGTFTPLSAVTIIDAINLILLERRKELLMRGLRWIDVKRLNKEGANINLKRVADQTYTLSPNDDKYALPLPTDIIKLTGLSQN